eukprot:GEMP01090047.1.p1 GENE.GEMP01090047.1~~GEMP01090047.1.p1  ORF type:complete len:209 (+),score=38.26 GEMP01090047.1:50-676(+)
MWMHTALFFSWCLRCGTTGCYSDYFFSWCNNHTEVSCVHDYTFSVSHFQRKLDDFYYNNRRPPVMEAFFVARLPREYQMEFLDGGCSPALIMAYALTAEATISFSLEKAEAYLNILMQFIEQISDEQRYMLLKTNAWPLAKAMQQLDERILEARQLLAEVQAQGPEDVDFVIAHCREPLDWIGELLVPMLANLTVPGAGGYNRESKDF